MLLAPWRWWRQKELCEVTGLDDGSVSRIVRRLGDEQLLRNRGRRYVHSTPTSCSTRGTDTATGSNPVRGVRRIYD
jgi:hypothetical protein